MVNKGNVFQATILLSVSEDILTATTSQAMIFQTNFVTSYNQLQSQQQQDDDTIVCDPYHRILNEILGYNPNFHLNEGSTNGGRKLQNLPDQYHHHQNHHYNITMKMIMGTNDMAGISLPRMLQRSSGNNNKILHF
jgi:hypothetical protein